MAVFRFGLKRLAALTSVSWDIDGSRELPYRKANYTEAAQASHVKKPHGEREGWRGRDHGGPQTLF